MEQIILLVIAVVPALLILGYYVRQDKAKPEPKKLIFKVFIWGCVLVLPAILLEFFAEMLFEPLVGGFLLLSIAVKSFIVAGLIEEWLKRLTVKKTVYNNAHFDEIMDGIVYAIVASLGFATIENIFYVLEGGLSVGIVRAFTALPLHAIAAGIMGYYIGKAKFAETPEEEKQLFRKGLIRAVMIHGLYDFVVFTGVEFGLSLFIGLPIILTFGFVRLRKLIKLAVREDEEMGRQISEPIDSLYDSGIKQIDIKY